MAKWYEVSTRVPGPHEVEVLNKLSTNRHYAGVVLQETVIFLVIFGLFCSMATIEVMSTGIPFPQAWAWVFLCTGLCGAAGFLLGRVRQQSFNDMYTQLKREHPELTSRYEAGVYVLR